MLEPQGPGVEGSWEQGLPPVFPLSRVSPPMVQSRWCPPQPGVPGLGDWRWGPAGVGHTGAGCPCGHLGLDSVGSGSCRKGT